MDADVYTPEQVVFVGGAPRSGTTLTHALLCTADGVCDYHSELSFYRGLVNTYEYGMGAWDVHTSRFFPDRAAYREFIQDLSLMTFRRVGDVLGRPRILCFKDPMLTPLFPTLAAMHADSAVPAKFITVIRHPDDVVRSRQDIHETRSGRGSFTLDDAKAVAEEFRDFYASANSGDYRGAYLTFCYEDIDNPMVQERLAEFIGVSGFNPARLWRGFDQTGKDDTTSPKFGRPIDMGARLDPLPAEWSKAVAEICGPVITPYGYRPRTT